MSAGAEGSQSAALSGPRALGRLGAGSHRAGRGPRVVALGLGRTGVQQGRRVPSGWGEAWTEAGRGRELGPEAVTRLCSTLRGLRRVRLASAPERGCCRGAAAGTGGVRVGAAEAHLPPAFQLCVTSLCSSSYSAWGLRLVTDLLALRSSSYWLVRTELLETVAEIDFRWVRRACWVRLERHWVAWCPAAGGDRVPLSAPLL